MHNCNVTATLNSQEFYPSPDNTCSAARGSVFVTLHAIGLQYSGSVNVPRKRYVQCRGGFTCCASYL